MNSFGRKFRISIFGESHGEMLGIVMDGVPAGIPLAEADFTADLDRRKAGAIGTTPRREPDEPTIVSGVFNGMTTGAPLTVVFRNTNTRSGDYSNLVDQPRPGHADFTAGFKWSWRHDYRGGGHFSARVTLGIVAAGVVAKKIIPKASICASITEIGGQRQDFESVVRQAMEKHDSVGGIVECRVENISAGWGEPFFDSVESVISHVIFAIPGIKGIEFGAGFEGARMRGSEHNDPFIDGGGKTLTNHAGGINGGITNSNPIVFRVAVKPTSSIGKPQQTYDFNEDKVKALEIKGRHDACIALRVPVIVEAMTAIALCDLAMLFVEDEGAVW